MIGWLIFAALCAFALILAALGIYDFVRTLKRQLREGQPLGGRGWWR